MQVLLDTHIALWAIADDERLSSRAREMILDAVNSIRISAASLWEISIKRSLANIEMPISSKDALEYFTRSGYLVLPVTAAHTIAAESLPEIHRDPFDRMLVAQALEEPMRLLTHDQTVARYSDTVILV